MMAVTTSSIQTGWRRAVPEPSTGNTSGIFRATATSLAKCSPPPGP